MKLVNGDDRGIIETVRSGRTILGGERRAAGFVLKVCCAADHPAPSFLLSGKDQ